MKTESGGAIGQVQCRSTAPPPKMIRRMPKVEAISSDDDDVIRRMPKVELHAHLTGCARESTILELCKDEAVKAKLQKSAYTEPNRARKAVLYIHSHSLRPVPPPPPSKYEHPKSKATPTAH